MHGPDWHHWSDSVVRPLGYRHDEPICRRVADGLFLGDVHAADPEFEAHPFEAVLSLTRDSQPTTTRHHSLGDGPGNDWAVFAAAAEDACRLGSAGSLLVHCSHGISRSATFVAIALADRNDCGFRDALDVVLAARPPAFPHPALHQQAVVYLAPRRSGTRR